MVFGLADRVLWHKHALLLMQIRNPEEGYKENISIPIICVQLQVCILVENIGRFRLKMMLLLFENFSSLLDGM